MVCRPSGSLWRRLPEDGRRIALRIPGSLTPGPRRFARLQVRRCTSFVIACQAYPTTVRDGLPCLGDLSAEQMRARQTHLLPLIVQKSISYLRIWVRPRRRAAPDSPDRRRRRP